MARYVVDLNLAEVGLVYIETRVVVKGFYDWLDGLHADCQRGGRSGIWDKAREIGLLLILLRNNFPKREATSFYVNSHKVVWLFYVPNVMLQRSK